MNWNEDRISPLVVFAAAGCLALLVAFGYSTARMSAALEFPYQMDPEEGFILNQAMRLNRGETIYPSLKEPPFIAGTYAPLYPFLVLRGPALARKALAAVLPFARSDRSDQSDASDRSDASDQSRSSRSTMFRARLPAIISELACGVLIAIGVFAMGRRQFLAALFAGFLFFASCDVYNWTGFARVDFMALAFNLAGLLLIGRAMRALNNEAMAQALQTMNISQFVDVARSLGSAQSANSAPGKRSALLTILCAGVCFTLALFTKQSQIMAPLAGCLFLMWRRRRWGVIFALALAACVLAIAGLLHLLTTGQYLRHTVSFNRNIFYWPQLGLYAAHEWRFGFLIWLALASFGLAGIVQFIAHRRAQAANPQSAICNPQSNEGPDWSLFFLIPCLLSLVGFAKAGVSYNYMIDPWAAICLYLGARMGRRLSPENEFLDGESRDGDSPSRMAYGGEWRARMAAALGATAILLCMAYSFFILTPLARDWRLFIWIPPRVECALDAPIPPRFTATATNPGPKDVAMGQAVEEEIKKVIGAGGSFLTELPIFEIRAGKPVMWQPFIMAQLAREGKWSDAPMVERFAGKRWDLLVTGRRIEKPDYYANYTEGMLEAIRNNYRFSGAIEGSRIFNYEIYVPER